MSDKPWTSEGPNVYDEHGEWIADCGVPSIYDDAHAKWIAKQIADDRNNVTKLLALLRDALPFIEALSRTPTDIERRVRAALEEAL